MTSVPDDLKQRLNAVHPHVPAPEVNYFVQNNGAHLLAGELLDQSPRKQDRGMEQAANRR